MYDSSKIDQTALTETHSLYSPSGVNTVIAFSDSDGNWLLQLSLVQHSISHCNRVRDSSLKIPPRAKHASTFPEKKNIEAEMLNCERGGGTSYVIEAILPENGKVFPDKLHPIHTSSLTSTCTDDVIKKRVIDYLRARVRGKIANLVAKEMTMWSLRL